METVVGVLVVVVVGGLLLWGQFGALFERTYRRDDPGVGGDEGPCKDGDRTGR